MTVALQRGLHLPLHLDRWLDDCGQAAADGFTFVRTDLSWASSQPTEGRLDGGAVDEARQAIATAAELGLGVWVRLLQRDLPTWFDNLGGFTDATTAGRWWPRWVELAANSLGDVVAGWVPLEAPWALCVRTAPGDARRQGEVLDTLVVAWRDAWRILRGGPAVSMSLDVAVVRPAVPDSQPHIDTARREDTMRWFTWLHGVSTGEIVIPGRADRELADLAGACDIVGIAARSDLEGHLHRAAEMGPPRPLAVTFGAPPGSAAEQSEAVERAWTAITSAGAELPLAHATLVAPI